MKIILLIAVIGGIEAADINCHPCQCQFLRFGLNKFYCSNLKSGDIRKVLKNIQNIDYDQIEMELSDVSIDNVTSEYFSGYTIKTLELYRVKCKGIAADILMNQVNSLEQVTFEDTCLYEFPFKQVQKLKILKYLAVTEHPKITHIPEWKQTNPEEMNEMDLGYNSISTIDENAFKQFIYLETLSLKKNKITSLGHLRFPSKLTYLDLTSNYFTKYPGEALTQLPTHSSVDLANNKIHTFSDVDVDYLLDKEYNLIIYGEFAQINCTGCQFKRIAQQNVFGWNSRFHVYCDIPKSMLITDLKPSMYPNCPDIE